MFDEVLFQERLKNFRPEPLIIPIGLPLEIPAVREDSDHIDLAKVNYLNFLNNQEIKNACADTIREYGVGTCGPRAFFGTADLHLELEESLAEFLHMKESACYAYGFVAITSAISAIWKPEDVVFIDEFANFPIQEGCKYKKSKVVTFSHNDLNDLRNKVVKEDPTSRKFLIVEAVSWTTGKLCPLPEFLKIAEQFKIRVYLEESYSIGVLGTTGRGLTEYYNIDPQRIDLIFGTLEGALGSVGGFCASPVKYHMVENQRLHGSGYMFSASLPTFLAKAALVGIKLLDNKPKEFGILTQNFHYFLKVECGFNVISDPESPFKVVRIDPKEKKVEVHLYCQKNGVHFIQNDNGLTVHLNLSLAHEKWKLERVYKVFKEAANLM